jgi:hypothetical protein
MLGNGHFYNRTIRKIVVAFGTMFNDIQVVRYTRDGLTPKEAIKVPLSYGAKEKYITRLMSDPDLNRSTGVTVPRMSFELTSLNYDSSRKLVSTTRNFAPGSSNTLKAQFVPVPYDFEFSLSIYVRNTEDGTQILEQILPFFTPDFNVTVDFIEPMEQKYDMPVILNSVTTNTEYEGDMTSTRFITWDLTFTSKAYIWPPVKTAKSITQANTNIYLDENTLNRQSVFVDYANGTGTFVDSESLTIGDRQFTGKFIEFNYGQDKPLVVGELNKLIQVGDVIRGAISGAAYLVTGLNPDPIKSLSIVIEPNPLSAEPDDEFGFSETITEWPNTL